MFQLVYQKCFSMSMMAELAASRFLNEVPGLKTEGLSFFR
jgi:hypothetical protein